MAAAPHLGDMPQEALLQLLLHVPNPGALASTNRKLFQTLGKALRECFVHVRGLQGNYQARLSRMPAGSAERQERAAMYQRAQDMALWYFVNNFEVRRKRPGPERTYNFVEHGGGLTCADIRADKGLRVDFQAHPEDLSGTLILHFGVTTKRAHIKLDSHMNQRGLLRHHAMLRSLPRRPHSYGIIESPEIFEAIASAITVEIIPTPADAPGARVRVTFYPGHLTMAFFQTSPFFGPLIEYTDKIVAGMQSAPAKFVRATDAPDFDAILRQTVALNAARLLDDV
jgi:hypothetical protein